MNQTYLKNILSAKFDFGVWKDLLEKIFPKVEIFTSVAKIVDSHVKDGGHVGTIRLDDGRSLAIFNFEVTDNVLIPRNRKDLRNIAANFIDQDKFHGALAFYHSQNQDDYRLTFIAKQTYFNESGELVKKETAPKRYTFLLGKNEPCTTAASRLIELANKKTNGSIYLTDVTDAFSVERLNKEFFNGYKAQYAKFLKLLEDKKQHRDYVKKMLGRLVFLQFLQKKGWMGVPATNENWEGGDKNYLANLIERYKGNDRILSDVLEPLFFDTLNKERVGDIADSRLGDNIKIPYLNGGLFDKDKTDALDIDFPYSYFEDLMEFFNEYNFTIDENDPDDAEVGVDPEMLGHIFENLLEDNKDKGAFYTPKEIVQYMCRQSVIQYLKTHETDEKYSLAIERLINESVVEPVLQNKETATRFIELLKNVKVCDPAIGSGAFPMGILYVLYYALHHLQSHAEPNKSFDSTKTKRNIIQNNIFGVDIEQGAVDIARLRFWLALVVDADEPQPLPNLDYKITCGNSLLNRYALDTPLDNVFIEYNKDKNDDDKLSLAKYKQLVNDYTNTSNHAKKDLFRKTIEEIKKTFKTELSKKEINKIVSVKKDIYDLEQPNLFGEELTKAQKSELKKLKAKLEKLESEREDVLNNKVYEDAFEWRFEFPQLLDEDGKFTGFDIVIGNPPYISSKTQLAHPFLSAQRNALVASKRYSCLFQKWDLYIPFIELGIDKICIKDGICTMIVPYPLTNQIYAQKLRELILSKYHMFELVDLNGTKIFDNATVSNCIPFIKHSKGDGVIISNIDNTLHISNSFIKNYSDLVQDAGTFVWNLSNEERDSAKHIDMLTLGDLCYISKGMVLYSEDGLFTNEDLVSSTFDSVHCRQYIEAKDMDSYMVNNVRFIEYNTHRVPDLVSRPTFRELYDRPKLMFNCLGKMKVMIDFSNHYICQQGIRVAVFWKDLKDVNNRSILTSIKRYSKLSRNEMENISSSFDMHFLLGILNSKYAEQLLTNIRGGDYHIVPEHIRKIPIPTASIQTQNTIADIVKRIIELKKINPNAGMKELENQIDFIVYKLYGLTYDEVLVVDKETKITREEYEKGNLV